jgi:hypothetical protein
MGVSIRIPVVSMDYDYDAHLLTDARLHDDGFGVY